MADIMAKLRYFPLGPVAGTAIPVQTGDLDAIAHRHGVLITMDEVEGENAQVKGDTIIENTMASAIEEISQLVITVTAQDEVSFRNAIEDLVEKYRAPRTVYATLGSSEEGKHLLSQIFDENDGWS